VKRPCHLWKVPGRSCVIAIILVLAWGQASAQGTFNIGFEEFAPGTLPEFAKINRHGGFARVEDKPLNGVPSAFEGKQYLGGSLSIAISSPDSNPITSFSLRLFVPGTPELGGILFGVNDVPGRADQLGSWQLFSGSFAQPVNQISVYSYYDFFENLPAAYGIDAVELHTVPEPNSCALLGIGFSLLLAFTRQSSAGTHRPPISYSKPD
jgi:hypothetical protein